MSKIEVKIIINNVEEWDTDWNNEDKKNEQLDLLSTDLKNSIRVGCGIEHGSIIIDSMIFEKSKK
jgi:hypothetical protein